MKKYIVPLLVSFCAFLVSFAFLDQFENKTTDLIVELDAVVPVDDYFQLFYMEEDAYYFQEEQSVKTKVKGGRDYQKIIFNVSSKKPIIKLRIDIGQNRLQKAIKIKDVVLKSQNTTAKYSISTDFVPNEYVKLTNGYINNIVIDNRYDPYFVSDFDVKGVIADSSKWESFFGSVVIVFLSFLVSISMFFVFYYKEIQLKYLSPYLYIFVFILILVTPITASFFDIQSITKEKRKLAAKPKFEMTKDYPKEFEQYYNDNFGLRTMLVNLNSKIKWEYFKISPKPGSVLLGKNGFMFYNLKSDDIYDSYSNSNTLTEEGLAKAYQNQIRLKDELATKNIEYIVGFFPNKHTIYKEKLPFSMKIQITQDLSLADQLKTYFNTKDFPFVDIREDLITAKRGKQLYRKFDSHWNSYGAYIGYKSFCKQTSDVLNLTPFDILDFNITYSNWRGGDLTRMMGIDEVKSYKDPVPYFSLKAKNKGFEKISTDGFPDKTVITINENCNNNQTVLVFRDSYASAFVPFLSLHFNKVIYIWKRSVDMSLVEKTKPDIVMSLCVERYLPYIL